MGLLKAIIKTTGEKINQNLHKREVKKAQPDAYNYACKRANGKFDKNWQSNYNKKLSNNLQKAQDRKELRAKFIDNL